ncbi:ribonuclease H-like domain-containing protein [Tanacetum coccineum]
MYASQMKFHHPPHLTQSSSKLQPTKTPHTDQIKVLPPRTAEEIIARERERKARTTLLMALPEDHLAKFHKMTDAKEMWNAIKSRFGGNENPRKMQKVSQKSLSQFAVHGAGVSTKDANQKFLRSLPSAWYKVCLRIGTKPGVDSLSFDDLYNNLRVFESDIKGSTASSSSPQNVAFVSENTSSTNEVSTAYCVPNLSGQNSKRDHDSSKQGWERSRQKEDSKTLVTIDGEGVDWTTHSKDEDYALMACNSSDSDTEQKELLWLYLTCQGLHAFRVPDVEIDDSGITMCQNPSELDVGQLSRISNVDCKPRSGLIALSLRSMNQIVNLNHLIRDCDFHEKRMARKADLNNGWNNVQRVNKQNQFVPSAVLTRTGKIPVNTAKASSTKNFSTARQSFNRQTVLTSTAMKVNTVKPIVNRVRPANVFYKTHSPSSKSFKRTTVLRTDFSKQKVNTAKVNAVSTVGGKRETAVKPSAGFHIRVLKINRELLIVDVQTMMGTTATLLEFQDINGGPVAFIVVKVISWNKVCSDSCQQRQLPNAGTEDIIDAGNSKKEDESAQDCFVLPIWPSYSSKITPYLKTDKKRGGPREEEQVFMDELERPKRQEKEAHGEAEALRKKFEQETENLVIQEGAAKTSTYLVSTAVLMRDYLCRDPTNLKKKMIQKYLYLRYLSKILLMDESWVDVCNEELLQFKIQKVWVLVDLPYGKKDIGTKWVYRNKKDEGGVVVINKASHKDLFGPLLIHEFYSLSMDVKKCLPLWENCGRGVGHTKVSHLSAVKRNFWVSKGQTPIWVFGILGDSVLGTCINADHGGYFYYIQLRWLLCASVRGLVLWILIKSLISLLPTITLSTTMAVLDSCPKHNMVVYLEKTEGNTEFHEIIDFLKRSSIHHPLTDEGAPSERPSEAQPTPSPAPTSEVPNEPQTDSSPAQTSEVPIEQQTDLSPRPSPTPIIPDSIPETSGENLGGHSSSDKSLSGNEGDMTLQSVYDLCLSLCAQVSDQAKEIQLLKAQIIKLKKQAKPVIKHHRAWLKSVSLKQRLTRKSFSKKQRVTKASVLTREGSEGRTRKMMGEDMEIDENYIVLMMLLSTDKEAVSTTRRKDRMTDQYHTRKEVLLSHSTLFYILVVDETIAKVLLNMSQAKAVSREKEKGRLSESVGILDAEIEVKQLESDEGLARKILEEWEEEEERKQIVKKKYQDEIPEGLEYSKLEATWFFKSTYLSDRDKISHSYAGREVDSYPSLILSYQVLWILPIPVRDLLFLYNFVSSDVAVGSFVPSGTVLNAFAEEIVAYEKDSNETHAIKKLNALCTPESFVTHSNFDTPGGTCLRFNNHELNVKEYKGIVKEREVVDLLEKATTVDFKNFFRSVNCYIGDSNAQMLIHKMGKRKKHVSNFSFDYLVENAKLTAIFWADEVSKYNYREFGDVVSFDATFKTNKYKMVFVLFTAIDNHRKCVTFVAGLLKNETTKSYIWLLKALMKAFGKVLGSEI